MARPRPHRPLVVAVLTLGLGGLAACAPKTEPVGAIEVPLEVADDVRTLLGWMSGSFSSRAQAETDSEYLEIEVHMVPIWTARTDGWWLYVEQGAARFADRPYRQRVYRVDLLADGSFISEVYELPGEPLDRAGDWRTPASFDDLAPGDLVVRPGCTVTLIRDGERFVGGTRGSECLSDFSGATYATSEVVVTAAGLTTWDRGFDDAGMQVWGPVDGPYRFRRVAAPAEAAANGAG